MNLVTDFLHSQLGKLWVSDASHDVEKNIIPNEYDAILLVRIAFWMMHGVDILSSENGFGKSAMANLMTNSVGRIEHNSYKMKAGDILFFQTQLSSGVDSAENNVCHCGVYVGKGAFIHASPFAGRVVKDRLHDVSRNKGSLFRELFVARKVIYGVVI